MSANQLADALDAIDVCPHQYDEPRCDGGCAACDALRSAAAALRGLEAVRVAAQALRDSGYDGPFMGEWTRDLFAAPRPAACKWIFKSCWEVVG